MHDTVGAFEARREEGLRNHSQSSLARLEAFARAELREFSRSYAPRADADVEIAEAQLQIARAASSTTWFILPPAAVLLALANSKWIAAPRLIVWALLVTLVCMITEIAQRSFFSGYRPDAESVRARSRIQILVAVALLAAWSSMVVFLWAPGILENHLLLILVLACTLSGWASMGTAHLATIYLTFPLFLASLVLRPLFTGDLVDLMLSGMAAGFWILMSTQALANYGTRHKMLSLQNERGDLVASLKLAKEASDAARKRAETASLAKSAFLANMSHELRTPLNAILGFSEIIHTRGLGASLEQYAEYGGFIHESGQHLLALINDILDLAKIEAGRFTLREQLVDLSRLLDDTRDMLSVRAIQAGLSLSVDAKSGWTLVHADERAMRQIVVNLTSNAIKFTPTGGSIVLFAQSSPEGIVFGVRDTGTGIAAEDHARVFESFGQGRHDMVRSDRGTGLGLPIVKGLAEAHGGKVILDSTPGHGTCVTVLLPTSRIRALARSSLRAAV